MEADHNKFQIVTKPSICKQVLRSPKIKLVYCRCSAGARTILLIIAVVLVEYLVVGWDVRLMGNSVPR